MSEVPTHWVEKAEVVPDTNMFFCQSNIENSLCWTKMLSKQYDFVNFRVARSVQRSCKEFAFSKPFNQLMICHSPLPLVIKKCDKSTRFDGDDDDDDFYWGRQFSSKSKSRLQVHLMWMATTPPVIIDNSYSKVISFRFSKSYQEMRRIFGYVHTKLKEKLSQKSLILAKRWVACNWQCCIVPSSCRYNVT